jgi:hypothetical protein
MLPRTYSARLPPRFEVLGPATRSRVEMIIVPAIAGRNYRAFGALRSSPLPPLDKAKC